MQFECISTQSNHKLAAIRTFLAENNLRLDEQVKFFIVVYQDENIIACGGLADNIIKCLAISERCRGEGVALRLASELVNLAYELNQPNLFIYTKPEYAELFRQCGFYTISTAAPNVVLSENSATRLAKQCQKWRAMRVEGKKIGAIVMNANPFTLGHRYLIEQALSQCDHLHLFVVGENASQFSYAQRFELVKQGVADLANITLHQGSDYIISRATFPSYFLKDQGLADDCYMEIDLKLFREHIAPALGITHRFVGSEPLCEVTNEYNRKMQYWLQTAEIKSPAVEVVELERKEQNGEPISASRVRKLFAEQNWQALQLLVPESTFATLQIFAEQRPLV